MPLCMSIPQACSVEAISFVRSASAWCVFRLYLHGELWLVLSLPRSQLQGFCSLVSHVQWERQQLDPHHPCYSEVLSCVHGPKLCVLRLWTHGELWLVLFPGGPTPCVCPAWPGAAHGFFTSRWPCERSPGCPCFNPLLSCWRDLRDTVFDQDPTECPRLRSDVDADH